MTAYITLEAIEIAPNRQRREFDPTALRELSESIRTQGLFHALVVREQGTKTYLVAGERRLRAIRDLYELDDTFRFNGMPVPAGRVPVVTLGQLAPLEAEEAELEENIRRVDLSWPERVAAEARLVALRTAQAEAAEKPTPTVVDIAREIVGAPVSTPREQLGAAPQSVRESVIVSKFLDDPEVAKAASKKEALKIIKKREERKADAAVAAAIGSTFTSASHTLICGDSLAWMKGAPASSFDIILTDPPYGMDAHKFGDSGKGSDAAAHFYDDSYEAWVPLIETFAVESFRLAKSEAFLFAFCDLDNFFEFRALMQRAGWSVHRTPLVWHNPDGFRAPWPESGFQRKYELCLYAIKGKPRVNALRGDVWPCRKDPGEGHPAQKPVELLEDWLTVVSRPGMRVLDPFGGSGSTLIACHELKLSCTYIEKDQSSYGIAVRRLQEAESNSSGDLLADMEA